ncbi:MAG: hemerythrin domain-containing protein, partial [Methyloligellaceae bacterium]
MAQTLDLLRQEHREMRVLLEALEQQLDLFEQAGNPDFELLSEIVDYFRGVPDLYHHPKEDLIYYYMTLRVADKNDLKVDLHSEHDRGSDLLNNFARNLMRVLLGVELPRDVVVKSGRDFLENEKRHMDAEENAF